MAINSLDFVAIAQIELPKRSYQRDAKLMQMNVLIRSVGELVDFGGQDKVIFAQTPDRMGPDFNREVLVTNKMQIRVVGLCFGQLADAIKKSRDQRRSF